jgi:hypothetical protein
MTEVDELTGREGGRWRVHTRASTYEFDLGAMTVTRMPGPTARVTINDCSRPIREIVNCRVGEGGYWTMLAEGGYMDPVDFYWQATSTIRRIVRLDEKDDEGAK